MDNSIILYSTHCPKCEVLENKLKDNNIKFTLNDNFDVNFLLEKGFSSVPVMEIDGKLMNFSEANNWINTKIKG